jgi:LacI family transcriptional regulator
MDIHRKHNPTIKDLAEHADVSVMTISRYFNKPEKVSSKTKLLIEKAISEINYTPNDIARSMVTGRTNTIGVVVPDIRNAFFTELIHNIEEYLSQVNYNILLSNTREDENEELRYIDILLARKVDGLIVAPVSRKSVKLLKKKHQHFVLVDRHFHLNGVNCIACDHYQGMRDALEYLVSLGHTNIGMLEGPKHIFSFAERARAYSDLVKEKVISSNINYIKPTGIQDFEESYLRTLELLNMQTKPSAIVTSNNIMGVGALKAIKSLNLGIPEDISFITFDRINCSELISPELAYIEQPIDIIGRSAAAMLFNELGSEETKPETRKIFIKPEIKFGASCNKSIPR